jgi:hypothetical protein
MRAALTNLLAINAFRSMAELLAHNALMLLRQGFIGRGGALAILTLRSLMVFASGNWSPTARSHL